MTHTEDDLARIFRAESGQVIAALISYSKDIDLAEDAFQDACLQAINKWPKDKPDNKPAWLFTVAKRRLIDRIRQSTFRNKQQTLQHILDSLPEQSESELNSHIPDERLKLIFTCCHPALSKSAQVALTLKTLCGLKISEIARAFLTTEVSMSQRITRAKKKIKLAGIPYKVPDKTIMPERIDSVLNVIYLIFNESYSAFEGQTLTRDDLAQEAIRLSRLLTQLTPQANVFGLLSLMLFHYSRRFARSSEKQRFIPLEFQDRKLWDRGLIIQADQILEKAMKYKQPESFQIQAAISSLHSSAKSWQETDWKQILLLYQSLYRINNSPIVALNYNVAIAHSGDLAASLKRLNSLEKELDKYQPFYASRAYVYLKLKQNKKAKKDFEVAIKMTKNSIQRDYLKSQLKLCESSI
ncbi:MAG: RNA polymerase sigma factor [Kangiellaceae bacterium]